MVGDAARFIGRLTTAPSPSEVAVADDPEAATIAVFAYGIPFRPEELIKRAPTGEGTLRQSVFMPHGGSFITTAAAEVAYSTLTSFTSEFVVVHSRLNSLDRTLEARPRTKRPRELSQRFWQVSTNSERSCRAFGMSDFR